jgi:hypothetical protein
MSTGLKVLSACLAVFGLIMVFCMILGFMHWIILGIAAVAAIYFVAKLSSSGGGKALPAGDRKLHRQLRKMEKDIDALRKQ